MSPPLPNSFPPLLGPVVRAGARWVPVSLQRLGVESALVRVLGSRARAGDLDFLEGRVLGIEITDLAWRWPVTLAGGTLACLPAGARTDVTIRGRSGAFLTLVLRRADPDTLFFQRDLAIEGDTELGLAAKNFLDSVEWDNWRLAAPLPGWPRVGGGARP